MSKTAEWYDPGFYGQTDRIERGDRISWSENGEPRRFGFAVRRTTKDFLPAWAVQEMCAGKRSTCQTVLARYVTKECG
jgi:hypothetical protein